MLAALVPPPRVPPETNPMNDMARPCHRRRKKGARKREKRGGGEGREQG